MRLLPLLAPLAAGVLCLALTACTPSAPDAPSPEASVTTTPTSEPVPEPVSWFEPESRYGLECATLVDPALVAAALPAGATAVDPLVTASAIGVAIPRVTSIISIGGDVCEWSNTAPHNDQYGTNEAYSGITITISPRPEEGWSATAATFGMPNEEGSCSSPCSLSTVAGDAWVTLYADGAFDRNATVALFAAVASAVSTAGDPTPTVTPERDRPPLPSECEGVLPLETVRSLTGAADAVLSGAPGGWGAPAEAALKAGDMGCRWGADGFSTAATVDWVRDGRWAYERAQAAGTFEPVSIAGLDADDLASVRCDPDYGPDCAVDIARGPDWINVVAGDRATAIAVAEAVIARVR